MRSVIVLTGLTIAALSVEAFADAAAFQNAASSRAELGKAAFPNADIKLRILVDKVMQPEAKWVTQEWMVKATADAAGRTCSLELTRADEGVLEDSSITIDAKLPPTLSLVSEHVFKLN